MLTSKPKRARIHNPKAYPTPPMPMLAKLWPGLVVALLTALVAGGLSGWLDLRDRMTRVVSRLDGVD